MAVETGKPGDGFVFTDSFPGFCDKSIIGHTRNSRCVQEIR